MDRYTYALKARAKGYSLDPFDQSNEPPVMGPLQEKDLKGGENDSETAPFVAATD